MRGDTEKSDPEFLKKLEEGTAHLRELDDRLLASAKAALPALRGLLQETGKHWCYEDALYRFYHQSWKVYALQDETERIVEALTALHPKLKRAGAEARPHLGETARRYSLNAKFLTIVGEGTGKTFDAAHNKRWLEETRPIVEAFLHARYFLEMAVKYATELERAPMQMPSGWAALLTLFGIR